MQKIPLQLIFTTEKVSQIRDILTKECIILRRTNLEEYLTPFDELDVEIIRDIDLFRMSTNVLLCRREEVGLDNEIKHVNIVVIEGDNKKFNGENVINKGEIEKVRVEQKETLIIGFKIEDVESIKGPYILGRGTKKDEEILNYIIKVTYDPLVLNCYHMESLIICSESDDEIKRKKIKGFRKAIASDIKVKLMNKKRVKVYNYDDIT